MSHLRDNALSLEDIRADIERNITEALNEDLGVLLTTEQWLQNDNDSGSCDITAQLIPADETANASVITREDCVVCGVEWVNETFRQLDNDVEINWKVSDGDKARANQELFTLTGNARSILTGERTALNFLQLLSGVATKAREYADIVAGTQLKILDTRKTLPGLRTAQKYAVATGGCYNHRIGLYDAFLIKENHIAACGGIKQAIEKAREIAPNKKVEVEVENVEELQLALEAKANIAMLDNFSLEDIDKAVKINQSTTLLEASGNVSIDSLSKIAKTGVDYTSIGAITKHIYAIDLSLRLQTEI